MTQHPPRAASRGHVAIVGGGLIGLSSAFFLHRSGFDVTVVERSVLGSGTSRGNAGMIVRRAKPLAAPGVVKDGMKHLFAETGAFFVNPRALVGLLPFLVRFATRSNQRTFQRSVDALDILNSRTGEVFEILRAAGVGTKLNREGSLLVYRDRAEATAAHDRVNAAAQASPDLVAQPGPVLDADRLHSLEPMLGPSARWGFEIQTVWWVDPNSFVDELITWVRGQDIEVVEGCEVLDVHDTGQGVRLVTTGPDIIADDALICAGAWSGPLLKSLHGRSLITPGKGYSFSLDPGDRPSRRCIGFQDIHVVSVPLESGRVRFAGTVELDGRFDGINLGRVKAIAEHLRDYVVLPLEDRQELWVGPRPMTPDGIPYIGRVGTGRHVFVAAGHNMEGLTLAPATGSVVADLLSGHPEGQIAGGLSPQRRGGLSDLVMRGPLASASPGSATNQASTTTPDD